MGNRFTFDVLWTLISNTALFNFCLAFGVCTNIVERVLFSTVQKRNKNISFFFSHKSISIWNIFDALIKWFSWNPIFFLCREVEIGGNEVRSISKAFWVSQLLAMVSLSICFSRERARATIIVKFDVSASTLNLPVHWNRKWRKISFNEANTHEHTAFGSMAEKSV